MSAFVSCQEADSTRWSSSSDVDRLLFDAFLRLRNRCRGAAVGLSERIMITNPSAAEVLLPSDRARLWALSRDVLAVGGKTGEFALSSGVRVRARYEAVALGDTIVAALVRLSDPLRGRVSSGSDSPDTVGRVAAKWRSLTNAERAVAEAVASGLTNREAGRRISVSAHTVDAHLRQIFRKLSINSRVELARLVGEHHHDLCLANAGSFVLDSHLLREGSCTRST